jgi:Protein of unknown function (DUF2510)
MGTTAPPGWYTDPGDGTHLRWWDGSNWTDYRNPVPNGSAPTNPLPPEGAAAPPPPPPGMPPPGMPPNEYIPPNSGYPGPNTGYPGPYGGRGRMGMGGMRGPFGIRTNGGPNSLSKIAIGFSAAYLLLALFTGFVLFGIIPVLYTFRAFQRREKLAPLAAVASGLTILVAVLVLTHHTH